MFQTFLVTGGYYSGNIASTELLVENTSAWVLAGNLPTARLALRGVQIQQKVYMLGIIRKLFN